MPIPISLAVFRVLDGRFPPELYELPILLTAVPSEAMCSRGLTQLPALWLIDKEFLLRSCMEFPCPMVTPEHSLCHGRMLILLNPLPRCCIPNRCMCYFQASSDEDVSNHTNCDAWALCNVCGACIRLGPVMSRTNFASDLMH